MIMLSKPQQVVLKQLLHVAQSNFHASCSARHVREDSIDCAVLTWLHERGYVKPFSRTKITLTKRGFEKAKKLFPELTPAARQLIKRTNSKQEK